MNRHIQLPQLAWSETRSLDLELPERWEVQVCPMRGHSRRALTPSEIESAVKNPIGTLPIRNLAQGKTQAVIIFDDIQRITRVSEIVPFVLEELAAAGIPDSHIRFVAATGCHAAMDRYAFAKKLGESVLSRFPVYNHNPFGSCVDVGTTSAGIRISANAEVINCDLKIAIGSVVPHVFAGFGGGPKIILPGVCSFETCRDFHRFGSQYVQKNRSRAFGLGIMEDNPLRLNMDEAARLVGLDFKIDTLMNSFGETVAVYAGSLSQAYPLAVQDAQVNYDTDQAFDQDVAIANTYAKVAECEGGLEIASPSIKKEGGELILISHAPEGHVTHYLLGQFGNRNQGSFQMRCALAPYIKRLIIYNKYLDLTIRDSFAQPERVVLTADWNDVVALIERAHPGPVKVAVYPDADIQYSSRNSGSKILSF